MNKQLIIFDLDGTLAPSKHPIDQEMSFLLQKLLEHYEVAIISGGALTQFKTQLIETLPSDTNLKKLYILPTSGTSFYTFDGTVWIPQYEERLSVDEKQKIIAALQKTEILTGIIEEAHGEKIEDRNTQITYSALGQQASLSRKIPWDPDQQKRIKMVEKLKEMLPEFSIGIGGATSIDITKSGINKSFGIKKLIEYVGAPLDSILFVGDALFPGGNDYPAIEMGLDCRAVETVSDSKIIIFELLKEKGVEYTTDAE